MSLTYIRLTLLAALTLLATQNVFAGFPTSSGGSSFCFFGCSPTTSTDSTLVFDFNPDNGNGLAPVQINFFPLPGNKNLGDLCFSGKVEATLYNHVSDRFPSTGTATYDILSSDGKHKGMCYSNVERKSIEPIDNDIGNCTYETVQYSLILKDATTSDSGVAVLLSDDGVVKVYDDDKLDSLLNGRFKVDTALAVDDAFEECLLPRDEENYPGENEDARICNLEIGFGVHNAPESFIGFEALFPATASLSGVSTAAGQVYFSDEVLVACENSADVGAENPDSPAIDAKSSEIFLSESLSMNANWCTNSYSDSPDCNAFSGADRATGSVITAIGDYQTQNAEATCVDSLEDLRALESCSAEIAIATCADSTTGYQTFPDSLNPPDENGDPVEYTCYDGDSDTWFDIETFLYSSAQGGGESSFNLVAIGAEAGAPGYIGDNTLPPILPGWTAIVSLPDNQPNSWNLSGFDPINVAYIHPRNGNDYVLGTLRGDTILGGSGADELDGNDGDDILQGGDNADILNGNNGNDLLLGYECDSINATCGTFLNNGNDDDTLIGGPGNDCLDGGRGNDSLWGDDGDDAFVIFGNSDNDLVKGYEAGDKIVDMTGTATVKWVKGSKRDDIPSVCEVVTSGNNTMVIDNVSEVECVGANLDKPNEVLPIVKILNVKDNVTLLPAQCAGHPFRWPNNR